MKDFVFELEEPMPDRTSARTTVTIVGSLRLDDICAGCYARGIVAYKHAGLTHDISESLASWRDSPAWLRGLVNKMETELKDELIKAS